MLVHGVANIGGGGVTSVQAVEVRDVKKKSYCQGFISPVAYVSLQTFAAVLLELSICAIFLCPYRLSSLLGVCRAAFLALGYCAILPAAAHP